MKEKILNALETYLNENNYNYKKYEEDDLIHFRLNHTQSLDYLIKTDENYFTIIILTKNRIESITKSTEYEILKFFNELNSNYSFVKFNINYFLGLIQFSYDVDCTNTEIAMEIIENSIIRPAKLIYICEKELSEILNNKLTATKAYKNVDLKIQLLKFLEENENLSKEEISFFS